MGVGVLELKESAEVDGSFARERGSIRRRGIGGDFKSSGMC